MPIRSNEFCRCLTIEVRDEAGEVLGNAPEFKYPDQLAVVHRGERPFEV